MTLATKKYRPVLSGLQLLLLRNSLRDYLNSYLGEDRQQLIAVFKIINNAATNAELETGSAYETIPKLTLEQKLGIDADQLATNIPSPILSESQILTTLSEEERNSKLAAYQQQLLNELGVNSNESE